MLIEFMTEEESKDENKKFDLIIAEMKLSGINLGDDFIRTEIPVESIASRFTEGAPHPASRLG